MKSSKPSKQTVPWQKIFQMATAKGEGGKPKYTIEQIARATQGEIDEKSKDKFKPTRARLAKFRATGVHINEKLVRLPKSTVRRKPVAGDQPKKESKPKKAKVNTKAKQPAERVESAVEANEKSDGRP